LSFVGNDGLRGRSKIHDADDLLGGNELATIDRWELERRARAHCRAAYLGDRLALCRALGRYKLYIDTRDVGFGAHLLLDGFWESWLTVFIARTVKPGWSVVDVGANHGYYTLLLADLVGPEGKVAAIEPNPHLCSLLARSVAVNGFGGIVEVHEEAAVGEDDQSLSFYVPENEPKNARIVQSGFDAPAEGSVLSISGRSLANTLAAWPRVDFLKIDVEGAEEAVIAGLESILVRDHPDMVLEFNAGRCTEPAAFLERLAVWYPVLRSIEFDCEAHPVTPEQLLDTGRADDWLLFLSTTP
jgi:FkbM family methyltransferase